MDKKIDVNILNKIIKSTFNIDTNNISIKRLNGGYKNKTYLINLNNIKYVLKVELSDSMKPEVDKNKLKWEFDVLKMLEDHDIPTPKAFYYSDGIEEFPYPFIIMEYISGNNFKDCKENLSNQNINSIYYLLGKFMYNESLVTKEYYYIPGFRKEKYTNNYDMLKDLFESILSVYENNNINIEGITSKQILSVIKKHKVEINDVKKICFCNIDLWDGNVIIKNKEIAGIVDFGDTYYCDELMTYYFHDKYEGINEYFRLGYNNIKLDANDCIRIKIYQLYSLLKTIVDCEIRKYGRFGKAYLEFVKIYNELK